MSRRQRRSKEIARMGRTITSKRRLAAGAGLTLGATLATTGSAQALDFTVTNLGPSGPGSLFQALDNANSAPGDDRILFQSGLSGTITPPPGGYLGIYDGVQILGPGPGAISVAGNGYILAFIDTNDAVTISGLTLKNGTTASDGGGIFSGGVVTSPQLTVSNAIVTGNAAADDGGAIYVYSGSLTVESSTISENSAGPSNNDAAGGAIFSYGPIAISNSTISGNRAGGDGGGIYAAITPADVLVRNSTIANNASVPPGNDDDGGGIAINAGSRLDIESATISGNSVAGGQYSQGGGVYAFNSDDLTISNSILADNSAIGTGSDLFSTKGAAFGFTLIESTIGTNPGGSLSQTGPNLLGVDPQLGPLQNNGGPTATQALAPSSPAVDKGNTPLPIDQRGLTRPFDFVSTASAAGGNGADMGAFELAPACQGRAATIVARAGQTTVGTAGADVIVGTDSRDVIRAGKGNDRVCARSGNDKVSGQNGKDRINGDAGKDKLSGGKGKDKLKGGKGKDTLKGGKGRDTLKGGPGRDKLFGGPQKDKLAGGAGTDVQKQ